MHESIEKPSPREKSRLLNSIPDIPLFDLPLPAAKRSLLDYRIADSSTSTPYPDPWNIGVSGSAGEQVSMETISRSRFSFGADGS